jgi:hypothetical protein
MGLAGGRGRRARRATAIFCSTGLYCMKAITPINPGHGGDLKSLPSTPRRCRTMRARPRGRTPSPEARTPAPTPTPTPSAPGPASPGAPAPYDGAAVVSPQLLRLLQARMHWHAAAGGSFATPPMPAYASPAQLLQAHPRASVWVLSAFFATPRFADLVFARVGIWKALLTMLELKGELPGLPIIDARASVGPEAFTHAPLQAVCTSPAAQGGPRPAAQQRRGRQQQEPAAGGAAPLSRAPQQQQEQQRNATQQVSDGSGAGGDQQLLAGQCRSSAGEQQCSSRPGSGEPEQQRQTALPQWRRPLSPQWWRQQWRRARAAARSGAGSGAAGMMPAPAPMANCTVWTREGQRIAEFTVGQPSPPLPPLRTPPPPPRCARWRGWLSAAARRGGAAAMWVLWPRWRLLRLLPMLQPELGWVVASVVVAGRCSR